MIAEDLNKMSGDGPDDDFIIKNGSSSGQMSYEEYVNSMKLGEDIEADASLSGSMDEVDARLEAAGIDVSEPEPEPEYTQMPEDTPAAGEAEPPAYEPPAEDTYSAEPVSYDTDFSEEEPDIDESEEELFSQIDEFRQKAARITALIREKQHRMDQLEEQLHEKEVENLRYQQKLLSMKKGVAGGGVALSKEVVAEAAVRAANEAVAKSDDRMTESLKAVEDKMSSMEKSISESIGEGQGADLKDLKGDIFDKIHDENVRVYRNIQDFMKDRDENDERFKNIEESIKATGGRITAAVVIGIINLGVMAVVLLTVLGII